MTSTINRNSRPLNPIAHLQRLQELLRMEREYETEEYRRVRMTADIDRLVARGVCRYPVRAVRCYTNSIARPVVELTWSIDAPDSDTPEGENTTEAFEPGRRVSFFLRDADTGQPRHLSAVGEVSYTDAGRMVVAVPSESFGHELMSHADLGVQLTLDTTSYEAMEEALSEVMRARDCRLATLRDLLLGAVRPEREPRDMAPVSLPWLNESQQHAVNSVLRTRDVAVVHGPPGTGKTTTLVEAIVETLHREPQVLVCAQSNTAVDWIAQKLMERGVGVLRIGNPTRVSDALLAQTYERRFADHPSYPELWAIRKEIAQLRSRSRKNSGESLRNRLHRLRSRAETLEIAIDADLWRSANVVACTLVGANQWVMRGHRFGTLFIDEAAQALEPACWIAIRHAHRVVLAGDHLQLPPTIKCHEAALGGLDITLMERIVASHPEAMTLLTVQYRMCRDIMQFPSRWFYQGRLRAHESVESRGILDYDIAISWIDTSEMPDMQEQLVEATFGRINRAEGRLLISTLEQYVERLGPQRIAEESIDFGVITPYKAQMHYLRSQIKHSPTLRPLRRRITVNTVDGFQGQERDVMLISLVRSNGDGNIGFLNDLRRMNVAITRARMKLIIVGNAATLSHHRFYRALHSYITKLNESTEH